MSALEKLAFSVDEAAVRAGCGRDAIYDAIRGGSLEAKKLGRRTLITEQALRGFLESLPTAPLSRAAATHDRRVECEAVGDSAVMPERAA